MGILAPQMVRQPLSTPLRMGVSGVNPLFYCDFEHDGDLRFFTPTPVAVWFKTADPGRPNFVVQSPAGERYFTVRGLSFRDGVVRCMVNPVTWGATHQYGIVFRGFNSSNFYQLLFEQTGLLYFRRRVGGVLTPLGSVPFVPVAGRWYLLTVRAMGYSFDCYVDNVFQFAATDPASSFREGSFNGLSTAWAGNQGRYDDLQFVSQGIV